MIPVVLSGGSGTRLWPVSRAGCPKQFADLFGEALLAKTLKRLSALGSPWVVATADHRVLTSRVLAELSLPAGQAVYEPCGRNTAPAVALACRLLQIAGREREVVGIFPADHLIADVAAFHRACRLAERCAVAGEVVTLGIRPTAPLTGYGYIEVGDEVVGADEEGAEGAEAGRPEAGGSRLVAYRTRGFHEKPDAATAERYLAAGRYLWNAGMFVFRGDVMITALERHLPALWARISTVTADRANLAEVYSGIDSESLDFGVMERLERQASIPCELGWSDVGSWDEVARIAGEIAVAPAAGDGESAPGVFEVAGAGSFVFPYRDKVYGLVGISDLLVVDTADALLIARRGSSQQVKELVARIDTAGRREATEHVFEHRPWGSFEVLRDGDRFKSKILWVLPGQRLSYQSHRHRSEHWVILAGRPEITLDDRRLYPQPGEAVYIPQGARHRIANPGSEPVELVEVQIGTYFGEDDIVRYEDDYDRA